ncbi:type I restriction enzyme, S subunit [Streptococcus equinus]|uniref:restriction endonuclease subunit S n=1 Tax=Streptococcus equinus TaxID=1335 RepID=UPI00087F0663|nr:restriction endonuclease subunit S [Streptococcus equinus]SDQ31706.1 type I restriction enzyme, S subunit [Streptococcus equinus]
MKDTNKLNPEIRFSGFTDDWEQRKVGDHCDMFNGDRSSKYPNAQDMVSKGIPFINAGDLENGHVNLETCNKISREKYDNLGGAKLQMGDIVYCLRGTLGKNAYIDNFTEGTVASSLVALRPKNIDGRYLFHILNSDIEYRQRVVHDEGAAQPNLSAKSVSEFTMPVPDIDEQKKISSFLNNLDGIITLHQRKLNGLKNVKKAMLEKMFPKNGESVPEIRFSGFTDDWEQRKLGEMGSTYTGLSGKTKEDFGHGNAKFITYMNVFSNPIANLEMTDLIEVDQKQNKVKKGDVFFTTSSETPEEVGMSCVMPVNADNIYLNSFCFGYRPEVEFDSNYLAYVLRADAFRKEMRILAQGISRYNISKAKVMEVEISIPSLKEQKLVGSYFSTLDNLITLHQRKLDKLKTLKKAMLEKMFI